jgi:hypothetical protein
MPGAVGGPSNAAGRQGVVTAARALRPRARWGAKNNVTALIACLLLIVMLVLGSRVHGVRESLWKFLAFVAACIVVLALLLAILAR